MQFSARAAKPDAVRESFVVVGLFAPEPPKAKGKKAAGGEPRWSWPSWVSGLPAAEAAAVRAACEGKHFSGEEGAVLAVPVGKRTIVLAGLGKREKATLETLRKGSAIGTRKVSDLEGTSCASLLAQVEVKDSTAAARAEAVAFGATLGLYKYDKYLSSKGKDGAGRRAKRGVEGVLLVASTTAEARAFSSGAATGRIVAETVWTARDTQNEPALQMPPRKLAEWARAYGRKHGVRVKVLGLSEIKRLKMGGLLGVNAGSHEEPRFLVAEWRPSRVAAKRWKTVAIVGKGITFDTGGISLKPGENMDFMKFDKCGAVAAVSVVVGAARLGLPVRVVACCPVTENMPGGGATRPGDILHMAAGKTVEVLNTDAEGRLVLGDGIWYAQKFVKPDALVTVATLTGAIEVALGKLYIGLFANDDSLAGALAKAGSTQWDRMWRMPVGDEWQEMVKGDYADLKNISGQRGGGSSSAAQFLANFVNEGTAWAHLDIASTAYVQAPAAYTPKGATGASIRALLQFLRDVTGR